MALMIHHAAGERLKRIDASAGGKTPADIRLELANLLAIYPTFAPAWDRLAQAWEAAGGFTEALPCRENAVAANTCDVQQWIKLARLHHHHLGNSDLAIKALNRALAVDPKNADVIALLVNIKQGGKDLSSSGIGRRQGPLVSAIVSTYKSERFLRGCLEDLEAQTIADQLEIIVVDSHSPQNERAIVEEFQKRYSNIVYLRTETRETIYGAWNRGVQVARGKYLTNANTDDRHRRDALEVLAQTLELNPDVTLVYADSLITTTENETFETAHPIGSYRWLEFNARDLLTKGCFCGPQPMWRREAHDEYGYFDPTMTSAGDYDFWLRLAQTRRFLHVRETLGLYLKSSQSVEHANREAANQEVTLAQERYRDAILFGKPPFRPSLQAPVVEQAPRAPVAPKPAPSVARIAELTKARESFGRKDYRAAWDFTREAIQQRPFHPEGFLLLAEIALVAGDGNAARESAQRAHDLAPKWNAPRQFLRKPLKGATHQFDVKKLSPASSPRLTVCVITKNEERFIGQCLKSVQALSHQIVVVDTGSTDRTVEIARAHGAEVHSFVWCDDFSAARNAALEHVTGDWVLMLDADEELASDAQALLRQHLANSAVIGWRLPIVDVGREAEGCSYVPRLFRNAPGVHFIGRVHEQAFASLGPLGEEWGMDLRLGEATLKHHGYTHEVTRSRGKVERNLRLLTQALEEAPNDPQLHMQIGLELARSGCETEALERYRESYRLLSKMPSSQVVPELRETLLSQFCTRLVMAKQYSEIAEVLTSQFARGHGGLTASLHFALGLAWVELQKFPDAAEHFDLCLKKRSKKSLCPVNADIFTSAPHHCLALSQARLRDPKAAEKSFQSALKEPGMLLPIRLDYARFLQDQDRAIDALRCLHEAIQENPQSSEAWLLGGQIALSRPQMLEFACDWTGEAVRHLPEDSALLAQRAEALLLSNALPQASAAWERLAAANPQPPTLAAQIVCDLVTGRESRPLPDSGVASATGRAFLGWYRKCIEFNAQEIVLALNQRVEALKRVLPEAGQILEMALSEATESPEVAAGVAGDIKNVSAPLAVTE